MSTDHHSPITSEDFHSIISTSMDGFLLVDMSGNILEANESYCLLTGYQHDQLVSMHVASVDAIDSQEVIVKRVATIQESGSLRFETKHRHINGTIIDVEVSANYAALNGGMIFSVIRDITRRRQAEEVLRESESRFKGAFEHSAIGMAIVSPEGKWLKVNSRIPVMLGYSEKELLAMTFQDITHPDDLEADLNFVHQMLTGEIETYTMDKRYIHKDGHIIWAQLAVSLVKDNNNTPLYFISQVENISERKLSEEALVKSESILNASQCLAKVGGWEWDVVEQKMFWSEEVYRIHDIDPAGIMPGSPEHIAKSLGCYNSEVRQVIQDAFQRCATHGEAYDLELPFTTIKGRKLWIRTTARPVKNDDGVMKVVGNIMDITDRKQMGEDLAKLAELNQRIFNSIDSNMAVIDSDGVIQSTNNAWERFAKENLGVDESRWGVGANYFVKYDSRWGDTELAQEAFDGVRKVQSGELPDFSLEYPCHGSGDTKRWFLLKVLPLVGENGSVLVSHANITKQKLAEDALKEAEWKFHALFENGPIGVAYHRMIYDDSGKAVDYFFLDANDKYLELTGVDPRGKTVTQAFPGIENDSFDWIGTFGKVARTGEAIRFEQYLESNDRWYDCVGYQYKPDHFVAAFLEITERKRAENELQRKQAMLERTESIAHVGSWELDVANGTVTWSDELFRITQLDPPDGAPSVENQSRIYNPEDMKELLRVIKIAITDGTPYEIESRITRPNGDIRICLARGFAERGAEGKVTRLFGSFQDITEQKRSEAERISLEQQLLQAQKMESLGVLAGGIAHDFNNILTSIVGNTDLALMKLMPESPVIEHLKRIEKSAARATDLAKQMLAYSGKGRFVIEPIDLNRLIEEMGQMLDVSISKKAVLRYNLTRPLPSVEVDATQIRQVVMNLAINASEAIGEKSGDIVISTYCIDCNRDYLNNVWQNSELPEGLYVCLEVADTGCGMDKVTQAKLFDPFFTTKFTGRGLGMAAVQGIVRGHKGAINVCSEPGKGSSFKILLPAGTVPAELLSEEAGDIAFKGEGRVLLVDDEETVLAIGSEMLRTMGFTVITANDGREAIEAYKANPDLYCVILDLTMPHMDGDQAFRELKILDPTVKVIMSSGYSEYEVTQKFAGKGLSGFIQKPYKMSALCEVLSKIASGTE